MECGNVPCSEGGTAQEEVADSALEAEVSGAGTTSHVQQVELQEQEDTKCGV